MRRGFALCAIGAFIVVLGCRDPATSPTPPIVFETGAPVPSASASAAPAPSASASTAIPEVAPAAVSCIVKYYGGEARRDPTGWVVVFADGKSIPYHDGTTRIEDRYRNPTIEDLFEQRYHLGPITTPPVDYDPGRIRSDTIFFAAFGHDAAEVQKQLVAVSLAGKIFMVHKKVKPIVERVAARLAPELKKSPSLADYFDKPGGTFNWRFIAGTDMLSNHSWAAAIDLDVPHSNYWRNEPGVASGAKPIVWKNRYPQAIVDAFEAEGFIWGGRWWHFDTMHFEYRPELVDPTCYP
jgi:hypothetical protein